MMISLRITKGTVGAVMPTLVYGLVPLGALLGSLWLTGGSSSPTVVAVRNAVQSLLPWVVVFAVVVFLLAAYCRSLPRERRLLAGEAFVLLTLIYALVCLPLGPLQAVASKEGMDLTVVFLAFLPVAGLSAAQAYLEARPQVGGGAGGSLRREFTLPRSRRARAVEMARIFYALFIFLPCAGLVLVQGMELLPPALLSNATISVALLGGAAVVAAFFAGAYIKGSWSRLSTSILAILFVCLELLQAGNWGNISMPVQGMGADIQAGGALLVLLGAVALWSLVAAAEFLCYRSEFVSSGYLSTVENSSFLHRLVGKE